MPSGTATKPGDVVTAMNGKTIQVVLLSSIVMLKPPLKKFGAYRFAHNVGTCLSVFQSPTSCAIYYVRTIKPIDYKLCTLIQDMDGCLSPCS